MTEAEIIDQVRRAGMGHTPRVIPAGSGALVGKVRAAFTPPGAEILSVATSTGVVEYHPEDLVITVRAGTPLHELAANLADHGQECPIASGITSTVGGAVASSLAPERLLSTGPVRDWVLGARVVLGDGEVVDVGARTAKNVTGYDLPRLLCGSWGSLAVILQVHLRTRPVPPHRQWFRVNTPRAAWRSALFAPSALVRCGDVWFVELEGHARDVTEMARRAGIVPAAGPPPLAVAARLSVPAALLPDLVAELTNHDVVHQAHWETGLVLVADPTGHAVAEIAHAARAHGGVALRLDGLDGMDGGHVIGPGSVPVTTRLKTAFDPAHTFATFGIGD